MDILLTAGLGDLFVLDSMMTQAERDSIATIHWVTRPQVPRIAQELYHRIRPDIRHVVHPATKSYFTAKEAYLDFPIHPNVQDWSILVKFGETFRTFLPSSFLQDVHKPALEPYVLIQAQTPDTPGGVLGRNLDDSEWGLILERLEAERRNAIVVDGPGADAPPVHPRITNMVGLTTYQQSIELLLGSDAFWGIGSSLAVLACQVHQAEDLWLKAPESWYRVCRYFYAAPHQTFPFIYSHLTDEKSFEDDTYGMAQIRFKVLRIVNNVVVTPGTVLDIDPEKAELFVSSGQAEYYKAPEPTKAPPVVKQATAPAPPKQAVKVRVLAARLPDSFPAIW